MYHMIELAYMKIIYCHKIVGTWNILEHGFQHPCSFMSLLERDDSPQIGPNNASSLNPPPPPYYPHH